MPSLAYLSSIPVERVKGLKGKRAEALTDAGIASVADLLLHAPRRYVDRSQQVAISEVPVGQEVTVIGTVKKLSTRRPRRNLTIVEAEIFDGTSYLRATWFNQAFRARQLPEGAEVALSGKVERFRGRLQMKSPAVDHLGSESLITGRVVPIHRSVGPVSPGIMRRSIHNALGRSQPVDDPLPESMKDRLDLIDRDLALSSIHFPETLAEADAARHRLVFDEFFRLEIALALSKHRKIDEAVGVEHVTTGPLLDAFEAGLPYQLTGAQHRARAEINADLAAPHPMHRLLQGEVGSGKTVVAVLALLAAVQGGWQGAVMAPTEVLAEQHYLGIRDLIAGAGLAPVPTSGGMASLFSEPAPERPVRLALLTSNRVELSDVEWGGAGRKEVLAGVADGQVDIVVGTHALIQEGVEFARLGLAVVDEQHRFGVHQRVMLRDKADERDPDLLIMTATPIPRTLSMTLYGDLDVTILDEMPPGRSPVVTNALGADERERAYDLIRSEVASGRQAFVVCPLVEESEKVEAASAVAEHERLQGVFADLEVGLLHGQMHPKEKEAVMRTFRDGQVDVLVATTVIEVGIDVPNATVMLIEDAHRFGLSQLHQLRGRVGRGQHAATCVLLSDPTTDEGNQRIAAMVATTDGFVLAEEDLRIRGQGTVFGSRQSGAADLRIADLLRDLEILIAARKEAFAVVAEDPTLQSAPAIAEEVQAMLGEDVDWLFVS